MNTRFCWHAWLYAVVFGESVKRCMACSRWSRPPRPLDDAHLGGIFFTFLKIIVAKFVFLVYGSLVRALLPPNKDFLLWFIGNEARSEVVAWTGFSFAPVRFWRQTKTKDYARRRKSSTLITRHVKRESCQHVVAMSLSRGGRRLTPKGLVSIIKACGR